jgi:DnaA family protein
MTEKFILTQLPLSVKLQDEASFDNFFSGTNEQFIEYFKKKISQQLELAIYLYGVEGVGKTHLLQACCRYQSKGSETHFYLPLEKHQQFTPEIFYNLEQLSLVCIDNISAIAGKKNWEEGLFYFYNRALLTNTRLIIADRLPAQELPIQLKDLQSRLIALTALEIQGLSDNQKVYVLQMRAHARGMELNEEVGQFLVRRCKRSMSNLFAILEQLDTASLSAQRKLTIPFVKAVLDI